MKLSTRIKKEVPGLLCSPVGPMKEIVLMVDCGKPSERVPECDRVLRTYTWDMADEYHRYLTKDCKCTLLRQESPVVNIRDQIIYHYTSTTYRDWCNS